MFMCDDCLCAKCPSSFTEACGNCIGCNCCDKEITNVIECIQYGRSSDDSK